MCQVFVGILGCLLFLTVVSVKRYVENISLFAELNAESVWCFFQSLRSKVAEACAEARRFRCVGKFTGSSEEH